MLFKPALLIAGAGLAVAQSISSQCSSALLTIASSSQATCLDLLLLAPLASNTNASVIPTINSWLGGMCSQGACSNSSLQYIVDTAISGCSSDLASFGLPTNDTSAIVTAVQEVYPAVRQIACLDDTSANSLCATELLNDIQSASGITLSINNISSLFTQTMSGASSFSIPQSVTCSNCSKAAYTIVSQDFPSLLTANQSTIQSECGTSFTDGQMPSGIQETASNSTSSSSGAASALAVSSFNIGVAMLVAVSSAFVTLA